MKHKLSLLTTAAVITVASQAGAQGYLSIGRNSDQEFERKQPLVWTVGAQVGYDSNANLSSSNEEDSGYISGSVGVTYLSGDGRRTALNFNANYSPLYYWDAPNGVDDFQNNGRIGLDYRHRVNPRLTITDSFYIAYEVEPDYSIGAVIARNVNPYLYGYNSLAAAYSWNRRFSTVTSWTISAIDYDIGSDSMTNLFAEELRYAFSRTTTGVVTLRYGITDSDAASGDYDSYYFLVGADHRFSPRLTGSIRAGAEWRDPDVDFGGNDDTTPYVETALTYMVKKKTSLRWYAVYGFPTDGTQGDADIRTGLTATHRFDSRLSGNVGLHWIGESSGTGLGSVDRDTLALSAGLDYILYKNISVNGGYSFTTSDSSSANGIGDYDRHMFQLGVSSRW